jgi:hypothetical protein
MSTGMHPLRPPANPDTDGFWAATDRGELALCWCPTCARFQHPPVTLCRWCGQDTTFRAVSGAGTLFSYIVVHRAIAPGYRDKPGHLIGLVELDDQPGLRLTTQLADLPPDEATIGMRMRADLVTLPGSEVTVPVFRPAPEPRSEQT